MLVTNVGQVARAVDVIPKNLLRKIFERLKGRPHVALLRAVVGAEKARRALDILGKAMNGSAKECSNSEFHLDSNEFNDY